MSVRVKGLLIIGRTLAPPLGVVVIAIASFAATTSVHDEVETYQGAIEGELEVANRLLVAAGEAVEELGAFVSRVEGSLSDSIDILDEVTSLELKILENGLSTPRLAFDPRPVGGLTMPTILSVKIPNIPPIDLPPIVFESRELIAPDSFNYTIPGREQMDRILAQADLIVTDRTGQLRCDLRTVAMIAKPIADDPDCEEPTDAGPIGRVINATDTFGSNVKDTFDWWRWVMTVTLAVIFVAWLSANAPAIGSDLRRGWAMLRGNDEPQPSIEQLRSQLNRIEAALDGRSA